MIRTQPIIFTPHISEWSTLLSCLGMSLVTDEESWKVFAADSGRIALHEAETFRLELWFDAEGAKQLAESLAAYGTVKEMNLDPIIVWEAEFDGVTVGLAEPYDAITAPPAPQLAVLPLWYTANTERARAAFTSIGLSPRISSTGGGWADFTATDGLAAVHAHSEEATTLAFEYSAGLEDLQAQLRRQGISSRLIDESFGRTLRLDHPDGGEEIWINEPQNDLYGYEDARS